MGSFANFRLMKCRSSSVRPNRAFSLCILAICLIICLIVSISYAQPTVLVNGVQLEQVDNTTVNGIDYVGASELSSVLGATYNTSASGDSLQIELAGQFILMPVFSTVQEAQEAEQALELRRFGTSEFVASTSALKIGDEILVPLKPIITAFGGSVDYVAEVNSVIAVFERAELIVLAYPQPNSSVERFVLNLSVPVNYKIQDMKSLSVLNLLFSQTNSQLGSQNLTGRGFQKAMFRNFAGDVEFRLELREGYKADIFSSPPDGAYANYNGVNVIVDVLAETAFEQRYAVAEANEAALEASNSVGSMLVNTIGGQVGAPQAIAETVVPDIPIVEIDQLAGQQGPVTTTAVSSIGSTPPTVVSSIGSNTPTSAPATVNVADIGDPVTIAARSSHIVLDPAPVSGANLATSDTSFDFVASVAAGLQRYGLSSSITRMKGDLGQAESRRNAGVGAAAFISINQADIPVGTYNLYYLGEVDDEATLDLAVRRNAANALRSGAATTNSIDQEDETAALRRKVLLNLSSGPDEAATFAQSMQRNLSTKGYALNNIQALPLYILGGAVGQGIVVEFSQQDIATPALQTALLEAILQLNLQ